MDFNLAEAGMGAVQERFEKCMADLIENVMDPNTEPDKKRSITIKFEYKPNKNDRGFGELTTTVDAKLAPLAPLQSGLNVGINTETGEMNAREQVQLNLFDGGPGGNPTERTEDPIEAADENAKSSQKIRQFSQG